MKFTWQSLEYPSGCIDKGNTRSILLFDKPLSTANICQKRLKLWHRGIYFRDWRTDKSWCQTDLNTQQKQPKEELENARLNFTSPVNDGYRKKKVIKVQFDSWAQYMQESSTTLKEYYPKTLSSDKKSFLK